ncbi:MAG: hypothetical protein AB1730_28410 [Myxococcota bacterium]
MSWLTPVGTVWSDGSQTLDGHQTLLAAGISAMALALLRAALLRALRLG